VWWVIRLDSEKRITHHPSFCLPQYRQTITTESTEKTFISSFTPLFLSFSFAELFKELLFGLQKKRGMMPKHHSPRKRGKGGAFTQQPEKMKKLSIAT